MTKWDGKSFACKRTLENESIRYSFIRHVMTTIIWIKSTYENWETFVLVSQRTSSCCKRRERWPAIWCPRNQGRQWHPGSRTSTNLPNFSFTATLDWSTCTQQKRLPMFSSLFVPSRNIDANQEFSRNKQFLRYIRTQNSSNNLTMIHSLETIQITCSRPIVHTKNIIFKVQFIYGN